MFQVLTQASERFITFPALQSNPARGGWYFLIRGYEDVPLDGVA